MLTTHQENVVDYFRQNIDDFLLHLMDDTSDHFIIVDDFHPLVINYLDHQLKKEVGMYKENSTGYHKVLDMLIEVNLPMSAEFFNHLCNEINKAFRCCQSE